MNNPERGHPEATASLDSVSPKQWEVVERYIQTLPKIDAGAADPDVNLDYSL